MMNFMPQPKDKNQVVQPICYQDPVTTEKDIIYLHEWIQKQPHLPQEHDDKWLKSFLSGCNYSLETCKKKLDVYFSLSNLFPYLFADRDPAADDIRSTTINHIQCLLPYLHPNGHLLAFGKLLDVDLATYNLVNTFRKIFISADIIIKEAVNHGIILVVDCKGSTLQHYLMTSPSFVRDIVFVVECGWPIYVAQIHLLNAPTYIEVLRKIVFPFLPEPFKERIHVYTSDKTEELFEHVPQELLPNEYGGSVGTIEELNDQYQRKLESCRDWFLEHTKKKSDESKRPEKSIIMDTPYGIDGSFRTLNVD